MNLADLCEVFTSVQGEGLFVGRVQIFVRFSGCNISCSYCDTRKALEKKDFALIENSPFTGKFNKIKNPVFSDFLAGYIKKIVDIEPTIYSISLTGGEPLLYADFINDVIKKLKHLRPIHLETNGTLPDALKRIISEIDFISMDLKPEFFDESGFLERQRKFLELISNRKAQVKIVITENLREKHFQKAIEMIEKTNKFIPLILQPDSKSIKVLKRKLIRFYKIATKSVQNVLILPQIHVILGLK